MLGSLELLFTMKYGNLPINFNKNQLTMWFLPPKNRQINTKNPFLGEMKISRILVFSVLRDLGIQSNWDRKRCKKAFGLSIPLRNFLINSVALGLVIVKSKAKILWRAPSNRPVSLPQSRKISILSSSRAPQLGRYDQQKIEGAMRKGKNASYE